MVNTGLWETVCLGICLCGCWYLMPYNTFLWWVAMLVKFILYGRIVEHFEFSRLGKVYLWMIEAQCFHHTRIKVLPCHQGKMCWYWIVASDSSCVISGAGWTNLSTKCVPSFFTIWLNATKLKSFKWHFTAGSRQNISLS